jgi:hypothetical protein
MTLGIVGGATVLVLVVGMSESVSGGWSKNLLSPFV